MADPGATQEGEQMAPQAAEAARVPPAAPTREMPVPALSPRAAAAVARLLAAAPAVEDLPGLLGLFTSQLCEAEVPLDRMTLLVRLLHPQIRAMTYVWRAGETAVEAIERQHGSELTAAFRDSPIAAITEAGADAVHVPIGRVPPPYPFPILDELKAEGFTDYAAMGMRFAGGRISVATFASRAPDGFASAELGLLYEVLPTLAVLVEARALRLLTRTLLDVYVGPDAGQRILDGDVRRGTGLSISAVLWFCDLRGFSGLADRLPRDQLIALLNNYFDLMGGAVTRRGGEVLKFIGDALLAIFPVGKGEGEVCARCTLALEAAEEAIDGMRRLNAQRAAWGQPLLGAGIALHVGEVMYGNIGAATRLDFTVIGPAVNLVTRLEGLTRRFDRTLLTSAAFAEALSASPRAADLVSLGYHPVKGLDQPVEVFGRRRPVSILRVGAEG